MSQTLDLGALFARADIITEPFDRKYTLLVQRFARLGEQAGKSSGGVLQLDRSFLGASGSADKFAAAAAKASQSATREAAAHEKATAATRAQAVATNTVNETLGRYVGASTAVQRAALQRVAAERRLAIASGDAAGAARLEATATARLASAQSSAIGTSQRLAAAQREAAIASKSSTGFLAGSVKMAGELGLLIGGIELGKKIVEFVGAGKELTDQLNGVQAAARATDAEMVGVRASVIAIGKDMSIPAATANDAAEAINDLVRAGIALPKAVMAARPALLLASAAQSDMAMTARILGDTLDEFMLPGEKAGEVANYLAGGATAAGGGLVAMFDAMKYIGPRARAVGLGVDDIVAAIADLSKAGIQGSIAGTGLAMMLQKVAHESGPGKKALKDLGVEAWDAEGRFKGLPSLIGQLHDAQVRFGKNNKRFLADISIAFGARAANVVAAFAAKGVEGYEHMLKRVRSGDVEKYAQQMNRGVGAALRQVAKQGTSMGIDFYQGVEPWLNRGIRLFSAALPAAMDIAKTASMPFVAAWHGLGVILGPVFSEFGKGLALLKPLAPVLGGVASGALAMYAAFKGYQIAKAAIMAVVDAVQLLAGKAVSGFLTAQTAVQGAMGRTAAQAELVAAQVAASQAVETAARDRAAAMAAVAEADKVAASTASTDVQVANADAVAAAALAQARTSAAAAAGTVAAADAAAAGINTAGKTARVGWASMLGPLAAVGIGIALLVGMFHKSDNASKAAAEAAKAYTDALESGGTAAQVQASVLDTVTKKLADNGAVDALKKLNEGQKRSIITGNQMAASIANGNVKQLGVLRGRLEDVIKAETRYQSAGAAASQVGGRSRAYLTERGKAAKLLLDQLNLQSTALSEAARKELANAKAFGLTASSIDKVSATSKVGSDSARQYAQMMGIVVDKNGVAAVSSKELNAAINTVANAYSTATASGSEYLQAVQQFSKSAGTSADRAALIGATLKAANGDALSFAGAMNSAAVADKQFFSNVVTNAKDAKRSTRDYLASLIDLKTGTIDYGKAGAGPLISDLQGIQQSAMGAAQAAFQHARATMTGKQAANEAYKVYVTQTRGQFIDAKGQLTDQAKRLGFNRDEALKLANTYFGMPKSVKTLIEQQGANPVVNVLNKIGRLLAKFTGQTWDIPVRIAMHNDVGKTVHDAVNNIDGSAAGSRSWAPNGKLPPGYSTVGERGWELVKTDSSGRSEVFSHAQSRAMTGMPARLPGFANGTVGGLTGNAAYIASTLRRLLGFGRAQLGGVLGNLDIESGLNPRAVNPDGSNSTGIAQWLGSRLTALKAYAARHKQNYLGLEAQTGYLAKELREGGYAKQINKMKDPRAIAAWLDQNFERSDGSARGARMDRAKAYSVAMQRGGIPADGGAGSSPAAAAIGGVYQLPGGDWTFRGTTTHYASKRAAENARRSALARAAKESKKDYDKRREDARNAVQGAIGNIGQQPASPKIDLSQVSIKRVSKQIDDAQNLLRPKFAQGLLTKGQYQRAQAQINALAASAVKQLGALRVKIHGGDLKAIRTALKGTASDVRDAFATLLADASRAGVSPQLQAVLRSGRDRLIRNQSALTGARNRLTSMKEFRSGLRDTLGGAFDASGYGSIEDLHAGLTDATGRNTSFGKNLDALRNKTKGNTGLQAWISSLVANGDSTTLETLFGSSRGQLAGIGKDVAKYQGSLTSASDAGTTFKFGETVDHQSQDVANLVKRQDNLTDALADLTSVLPQLARRPQKWVVGGHEITATVVSDPQFDAKIGSVVRKLTNVKRGGRNGR